MTKPKQDENRLPALEKLIQDITQAWVSNQNSFKA